MDQDLLHRLRVKFKIDSCLGIKTSLSHRIKNKEYHHLTEFENDMVNNESNIFISESEDFNLGLYLKSHFDINDIKYINFDKIALLGYLKNLTFSLGVENLNLKLDTLPQIIYVNNILTHDLSDKTKLHIGGSIGVNLHTKNIEYAL